MSTGGRRTEMTAVGVEATLAGLRDPKKADFYPRFFRTGKGEYGEGDRFVGVVVTNQRKIARRFRVLILSELAKLLHSPMHEHRLTALFILVDQFQRADAAGRRRVAEFYLNQSQGEMRRWWGANDGAGSFSKYG